MEGEIVWWALTTNPVNSQSANIANMAELWYSESSITIEKVKYLFETYSVLPREWNFAPDIGWGLPFCFFICSFLYFFTSYFFISLFTYFFLSFFLFYLFVLSFILSVFLFTFFPIFLAPASKLFRVTWVNKLHLHFSFRCSGVSGCSGVPVFWGVPVFLVLVHAK